MFSFDTLDPFDPKVYAHIFQKIRWKYLLYAEKLYEW